MRRRSVLHLDALVPLVVGGVIAVGGVLHSGDELDPLALALGLAAAGSLVWRRRAPGWTLAASGLLALALVHVDPIAGATGVIAPAVALYSLGLTRGRREQLLAAAAAIAAVVLADLAQGGGRTLLQSLGHAMLVAIPLLAADAHRNRLANLALQRERLEQEAERRAEQERLRIARDLHDVVAHTLTTINVQAATAAELLDRDPAHARAALSTIEEASRDAIAELRAVLGVLRRGEEGDAPLSPAPGVDAVPLLVERLRAEGMEVRAEVTGERPERISDAVSLAAFRIVQESLTNARRHAPGVSVRVSVVHQPTGLALSVDNAVVANGAVTAPGVGIVGMSERAAAVGGTLIAGPVDDEFRVEAQLPYAG